MRATERYQRTIPHRSNTGFILSIAAWLVFRRCLPPVFPLTRLLFELPIYPCLPTTSWIWVNDPCFSGRRFGKPTSAQPSAFLAGLGSVFAVHVSRHFDQGRFFRRLGQATGVKRVIAPNRIFCHTTYLQRWAFLLHNILDNLGQITAPPIEWHIERSIFVPYQCSWKVVIALCVSLFCLSMRFIELSEFSIHATCCESF